MAQYPNVLTGPVTGATLAAMLPQTFRKTASTARASTTTPTADPELSGISLGVGTWEVSAIYFTFMTTTAANAAVAGFKVNWSFSGSASGNRACLGMAFVSTNTSTTDCTMRSIGSALTTDQSYGCLSTFYQPAKEDAVIIVTTAGTLAVNWSQAASGANAVNLGTNSIVRIRQIE